MFPPVAALYSRDRRLLRNQRQNTRTLATVKRIATSRFRVESKKQTADTWFKENTSIGACRVEYLFPVLLGVWLCSYVQCLNHLKCSFVTGNTLTNETIFPARTEYRYRILFAQSIPYCPAPRSQYPRMCTVWHLPLVAEVHTTWECDFVMS